MLGVLRVQWGTTRTRRTHQGDTVRKFLPRLLFLCEIGQGLGARSRGDPVALDQRVDVLGRYAGIAPHDAPRQFVLGLILAHRGDGVLAVQLRDSGFLDLGRGIGGLNAGHLSRKRAFGNALRGLGRSLEEVLRLPWFLY